MKITEKEKQLYSTQSRYSDPCEYGYLFDSLPDSVEVICKIIRGVVIHQHDTKKIYNFNKSGSN